MAQPLTAGLPTDYDLSGGFVVRVTAVDPTSGALVSGVNVSNVVISGRDLTTVGGDTTVAFDDPLWISLPVDETSA